MRTVGLLSSPPFSASIVIYSSWKANIFANIGIKKLSLDEAMAEKMLDIKS